jgi:16S rRNA (adenine1518-N6/adenine1519-N6)-dimethyltransferase
MYTLKKSLGQHFLHDESVVERIINAVKAMPVNNLLEVGPGGGALTRHLVNLEGVNFKAVELDQEKVDYLLRTYPVLKDRLIRESILDISKPFDQPFTVVGNFPYNISTQIMFKVLEWKDDVQGMVGMFQKEVAQRIAATEGNKVYGVLSVLTKAFFKVEYLFEVHEQAFNPPPKVKSAVIRLTPLKEIPEMKSERAFFNLVKTAFNQRRKMLRNGVKGLFDAKTLEDELFTRRAEQLSVREFTDLTFKMTS